ncbi:MAG: hypothetical protein A2V52_05775 [Actinobacteria bacterium RBG_19FT_COMBO_54_7]|uniref:GON domain-containing protein n=1 Tax=Candidatus Solincola sediminis TaxID=1797199 RepID=A0A1F2WMY9_9ACTN|nr:MAG: hypothetical protein A2W01_06910 [Candidatus Solincola sediminis]OFW58219.1 MAG: hypothetical protein A2Y75_08670 [Candidatus Solincola sediminis]OFW65221.1 MAG: hypothetical protein A2V52_05775 [Actinobacteria bacterium RBG_19FT_COMBO_54_7]
MGEDQLKMTGYCGLYCGDCVFKHGTINDLAQQLLDEFTNARLDKIVEVIPFIDEEKYKQTHEFLESIVPLRCTGCREDMRSKFCDVANCAREKEIEGCWGCAEFSACSKMEFLAHVHGDAHIKNLEKIKDIGLEEWIEGGPLW